MVRFILIYSFLFISCAEKKQLITSKSNTNTSFLSFKSCKSKIIIDSVIDLQGEEIKLNCDLDFRNNGYIKNGTLIGNNSKIISNTTNKIFSDVYLKGTWNIDNGKMYWFTDGRDPKLNFKSLCNLINIDAPVYLDRFYDIEAESINSSYATLKDIKIMGTNSSQAGLCLLTKHSIGEAYFKNKTGNNILLKNISIKTKDSKNHIKPIGYDYHFARCDYSSLNKDAIPCLKYFIIDSCLISGAVSFKYAVSSNNTSPAQMLNSGIENIQIKNSTIEESVTLLELSNGKYESLIIDNNRINNIYGCTFFFPLGGMPVEFSSEKLYIARKICQFKNNQVKNDFPINSLAHGYMSPLAAKGNNFEVENNIIEDVINLRDGIETVPFYCSASGLLEINNNKIKNCLGRGIKLPGGSANCLLKLKGAKNVIANDNRFILEKDALKYLGVITIVNGKDVFDVKNFRFCLIGSELNKHDFQSSYKFRNNLFSTELLTDLSHLSRSNIDFEKNTFLVNNLVKSDNTNWGDGGIDHSGTFFILRDSVKNGYLNFVDNYTKIVNLETDLYFTKDYNDNKWFKEVNYKNNIFELSGNISLALPRSLKTYTENTLSGKGCIFYNEMSTANLDITLNQITATNYIHDYYASSDAPFHIKSNGTYKIKSDNNISDFINLMDIRLNDLYYNKAIKTTPIIVDINVKLKNKDGKAFHEKYQLILRDHQSIFYKNSEARFRESPTIDAQNSIFYTVLPDSGRKSQYPLSLVSNKHKSLSSQLRVLNTNNVKSFDIDITVNALSNLKNNKNDIEVFLQNTYSAKQ